MARKAQASIRKPVAATRFTSLTPGMTRVAVAVALLMVIGGASLWFRTWIGNPENLRIQKVDWQGDFQFLKQAELEALAKSYLETNLFRLDATGLELELEKHPWIRGASLRKVWPDQLNIEVETQLPIAFWGNDHLLNQFGEIFVGELPEKQGVFPLIYSPQDNGREMGERYVRLSGMLKGLDLEIVELTEDERGSWQMKLRQGPAVVIGRKEQDKRMQRFRVGYMRELRDKFAQIDRIDLRYTNGFAVEWKQGSSAAGTFGSLSPDGHARRSLGS